MDRAFTNLKDHHELYCLGHLVEGAVAYAQATGKEKLLKAACRYADDCVAYFGPDEGQCMGYPGHEIVQLTRQKWFGCACCPPNIARLVSSVQAYAYTASEEVLYTHLYLGSELAVSAGGKEIRLRTKTDMPWSGHFRMEIINADACGAFYTFAFRLPGWSEKTQVLVCRSGEQHALEINGGAVRHIAGER